MLIYACFLFNQVDVYSFGLLLCEMCIRELPVPQEVHCQILQVTNGALRGLIEQCVKRDPEERPTMSDIICELEQLVSIWSLARTYGTTTMSRTRISKIFRLKPTVHIDYFMVGERVRYLFTSWPLMGYTIFFTSEKSYDQWECFSSKRLFLFGGFALSKSQHLYNKIMYLPYINLSQWNYLETRSIDYI